MTILFWKNYFTLSPLTEKSHIKTLFKKMHRCICILYSPLHPFTHNRKALATVLGRVTDWMQRLISVDEIKVICPTPQTTPALEMNI